MLLGRRACSGAGKGARRHVPIDLRRPQNLAGPPWRGWSLASLLRRHVAPTARRVDCLRERILSLPMVGAILDLKKKRNWGGVVELDGDFAKLQTTQPSFAEILTE